MLGEAGQVAAPQSLGGEDFGWYLDRVPGAMMRLGTRTPGGATYDLHQGNLRIDERAIGIGAGCWHRPPRGPSAAEATRPDHGAMAPWEGFPGATAPRSPTGNNA